MRSILSLLLLLAACGEPTGPLGPSGGDNRFRVIHPDDKESFDTVDLEIDRDPSGLLTMYLSGGVDPVKNAVDDEYSLGLAIQLDHAALLEMAVPGSLVVKATASYAMAGEDGTPGVVSYQLDPSNAAAVKGLFFKKSCFCLDDDEGEQSFDGSIEVAQLSPTEVTGTLSLHLTGDVPNYTDPLDVVLTSEFNLAIP